MESPVNDYLLVLNTCPNSEVAQQIADILVSQSMAACVNIMPGLSSTYLWQGKIERASEVLLLIKTHVTKYQDLQQTLEQLHPYELPEIIAVPLARGLTPYLDWIATSIGLDK
ncbi:MAG: divalent-cation tolerance protein CutA [Gammaproteobacteria bacterium]|nr:divalent-cation tolerance protein CutA [Gammaproteobacteria bacterium]